MKTKYSPLHRGIVFLSAMMIFVSMFAVPAFAADPRMDSVDLLVADSYTINGVESVKPLSALRPLTGMNTITWSITSAGYYLDYISLFITAPTKPAQVVLRTDATSRYGTYVGSQGNLHEYKFTGGAPFYYVQLGVAFGSATSYFSVNSLTGYYNKDQSVPSTYAYCFGQFRRTINDQGDYEYRSKLVDYELVSYPWQHANTSTELGLLTGVQWLYSTYYFDIQTNDLPFDSYDTLVVQFTSPCGVVVGDLALYERGGNQVVDTIPLESAETFDYYAMEEITVNGITIYNQDLMYFHRISFDISDINVKDYTFDFNVVVEKESTGRLTSDTNQYGYYTFFELDGIYMIPSLDPVPWYQVFWSWLSSKMDGLERSIVQAIQGITIPGATEPATDPMQDPAAELATQASEFNEAVDIMESVTRPSVDFDGMLDDMIQPDHIAINAMQAITGEKWVTTALVMAVTLGICSLILFGKRK